MPNLNLEYTADIIDISSRTPINTYNPTSTAIKLSQYMENNGYTVDGNIITLNQTQQINGVNNNATVPIKAVQTENGIELKPLENTVKTQVSPMSVIMPALTGAGIGWELYKEYPQFWEDLSNALFGSTTPITDTNYDTSTFIDVIVEAVEDGGLKAYCDKRTIQNILEKSYDLGAFFPNGYAIPQYTESGEYFLTGGGFSIELVKSLIGKGLTPSAIEGLEYRYNLVYNATQFDSAMWRVYNDEFNRTHLESYLFKLNNNPYTITKNGATVTINKNPCVAWMYFINNNSGSLEHGHRYTDLTNIINQSGWVSTVGATYQQAIDGLKFNPNNTLVTNRENVFDGFDGWLEGTLELPTLNPQTGVISAVELLPLGAFDIATNPSIEPTPQLQLDTQTGIVPQLNPFELPQWLNNFFNPTIVLPNVGTPSELPNGSTPVVIPPSNNNSSKLFTVYNPNSTQLNALGGYLWSDNITTLIKELFANNRMDAIISLHQVYCTPSTTTAQNIILGNLNSGVSAPVVNNQYVEINCGTQYIAEMYGDARDYLNVDCQVYLPFIGFRNVDAHDIINCYLNIKYTIDIYTGSCLAQLIVTKGSYTQTLYTFEGNCSVQIPLTGSDRARIIGAIASTVATGISTGGVGLASMAVGQVASGGAQASIQRTSGFSGNCGAMAIKKPYIVMTRLKSADAVDYNKIVGNPTNKSVYLVNCKGFTRVKEIHLDNLKCTDEEKRLIYNALKQGIVL